MTYTLTETIQHGNYEETRAETYNEVPNFETFAEFYSDSPYAGDKTKEVLLSNVFFRETYDTLLVNFHNDITAPHDLASFGWSTLQLEETEHP